MRLAVVADDAGFDAATDEAILRCAREGILTSCSLVPNGETAGTCARAARAAGLEIGVHLNLTSGPPLSGSARTLRACGCFGDDKRATWSGLARAVCDPHEVVREVSAQIDRVASLAGTVPAHVNGHNHVHVLPAVRDAIRTVCARLCSRTWVRVPSGFRPDSHEQIFATALRTASLPDGTAFAGHAFFARPTAATLLDEIDEALERGIGFLELMVHPGARPGSPFTSSPDRDRETAVLCDPAVRIALARRGVDLIPVAAR